MSCLTEPVIGLKPGLAFLETTKTTAFHVTPELDLEQEVRLTMTKILMEMRLLNITETGRSKPWDISWGNESGKQELATQVNCEASRQHLP